MILKISNYILDFLDDSFSVCLQISLSMLAFMFRIDAKVVDFSVWARIKPPFRYRKGGDVESSRGTHLVSVDWIHVERS